MDLTTLRVMMEALKTSSDIETLTFHNAGLTAASIAVLVEGLQHTSIRSLGLDYNTPPPPKALSSPSPVRQIAAEVATEAAGELAIEASSGRNFAGLVREGTARSQSEIDQQSALQNQTRVVLMIWWNPLV